MSENDKVGKPDWKFLDFEAQGAELELYMPGCWQEHCNS